MKLPGNRAWQPDLSNGQLLVQKPDGLIQFYAQPGAYSIWVLGSRNVSTAQATFGTNSPDGTLFRSGPRTRRDEQLTDPGNH